MRQSWCGWRGKITKIADTNCKSVSLFCVAPRQSCLCLPLALSSHCLALCLTHLPPTPPPPSVQGSRVQILPSAVRDHAVRLDPRAAGCSKEVLPAHRPCVSHRTTAWARTRPLSSTRWTWDRGWGGGPVMLGTELHWSLHLRSVQLCAVAVSPQNPFTWFTLNAWLQRLIINRLSAATRPLPQPRHHTRRHAYTHEQSTWYHNENVLYTRCSHASTGENYW